MINLRKILLPLTLFPAMLLAVALCYAQEWEKITNPEELRELLSGKEMDGKYWVYYFRPDGKMAYLVYDFMSVREWAIKDNGDLCLNVYSMPDRIIDCFTIDQTSSDPKQHRITGKTGVFIIKFTEPSERLVNAVMEKAGPE